MFDVTTAGESHGPGLVAIIHGLPAGLRISVQHINLELGRRQKGAGRGDRMKIEQDQVEIISGVRFKRTMGSPIALLIRNKDWENWHDIMSQQEEQEISPITKPRPGHADFAGVMKTGQKDIRNILERASARETACRVAAGAIAKTLLKEFNINLLSHVSRIGSVSITYANAPLPQDFDVIEASEVRCFDRKASELMKAEIEQARTEKDSLGGIFEVVSYGLVPGLGGYSRWDERLDGRLAAALMSIPAIKAVEIGDGFWASQKKGSNVHDEIFYNSERGFYRKTNRAGGVEGGMTNGEPLITRAYMKPISTLAKPLRTVDMLSKQEAAAFKERADVCAVPAAGVVGEAMVAIVIASALMEKFGSDCLEDMLSNYKGYVQRIETL